MIFLTKTLVTNLLKKGLCLMALVSISFNAEAQLEAKLSTTIVFSNIFGISVEHGINENMGIEGDFLYAQESGIFDVAYKYYFNPKAGLDRFYAGTMLGITAIDEVSPFFGFEAGYKIVSAKRLMFELGLGLGRGLDGIGGGNFKLHVGYRFKNKKKKEIE